MFSHHPRPSLFLHVCKIADNLSVFYYNDTKCTFSLWMSMVPKTIVSVLTLD